MKRLKFRFLLVLGLAMMAFQAQAVYQVYDLQMKLKTTRPVSISLPYPMNLYFSGSTFRAKVTETVKGYVVCDGPYNLSSPDFVYLKNMTTGEEVFSGGGRLSQSWNVYDRLSPTDKSVELLFNFWWTGSSQFYYDVYCAGEGKIKNAKYKQVFLRGNRVVTIADGLKGELTGEKSYPSVAYVATIDGEDAEKNSCSAVHGTWRLKYNNNLSKALYRRTAVSGGAICSDDGDVYISEDTRSASTEEIRNILGL